MMVGQSISSDYVRGTSANKQKHGVGNVVGKRTHSTVLFTGRCSQNRRVSRDVMRHSRLQNVGFKVTRFDQRDRDYLAVKLLVMVVLILSSIYTVPIEAQPSNQDEPGTQVPLTFGLGGATHRFGASVNIGYEVNFQTLSFEFLYLTEVILPLGEAEHAPASKDIEYSILYGIRLEGPSALASISSGVSLVKAIHVSGDRLASFTLPLRYTVERVISIGVPLRAQFILKTSEDFGFGLTYFSSFNGFYNYDGVVFSLRRVIH